MKRSSPLILGLVALTALGLSQASADTFRFKDGRVARGKVLAEFRDYYFVQIDSELARFVAVRDLERVLDESDQPRTPNDRDPSPAFAIDSPVGEVRFVPRSGPAEDVTVRAFAQPGDRIATGETGLARIVLPSGVTAKVGPSSRLVAASAESLELEQGEVFLTATDTKTFDVGLARGLRVRAQAAKVDVARTGLERTWRIAVHSGEARIESETFRLKVDAGHAATLEGTEAGVKLTAEASNAGEIEAMVGTKSSSLAPGQSLLVDGGALATAGGAGTWRFQRIKGNVLVRAGGADMGATARFVPVRAADMERLRLEDGDAVQTDANSEAVLLRDDGANATLGETSEVAIAGLVLATGTLRVDALRTPVPLATPGGEARITFASLVVRRPVARDMSALEASVVKGDAKLPVAAGVLTAPPGAKLTLRGTPDETVFTVTGGAARFASTAQPDCGDPVISAALEAGQGFTVRALHQDGLAILLEGSREIGFGPERVGAQIRFEGSLPSVVFASNAVVAVEKETKVRFRAEQSLPVAVLAGGERVRLPDGQLQVTVERNAMRFADGTTVGFKDKVEATLRAGEGLSGATIGQRREDRFEVPRRARVVVGRRGVEHATVRTEGGIALWVHDGAPAVQARLTTGRDSGMPERTKADVDLPLAYSFTMPGTPPLTVAASRRVVVLATRDGEFVILDDPALIDAAADRGLFPLAGTGIPSAIDLSTNHLPELLAQPPPASPVR